MGNALHAAAANSDHGELTAQDIMQPMIDIMQKCADRGVFDGMTDGDGNPVDISSMCEAAQEQMANGGGDQPLSDLQFDGGLGSFRQLQAQQARAMDDFGPEKIAQILEVMQETVQDPGTCESLSKLTVASNKVIIEQFGRRCAERGILGPERRRRFKWFLDARQKLLGASRSWQAWIDNVRLMLPHVEFTTNCPIQDWVNALEAYPEYDTWDLPDRPAQPIPEHEQTVWDRAWADPVPDDVSDLAEGDLTPGAITVLMRYVPFTCTN